MKLVFIATCFLLFSCQTNNENFIPSYDFGKDDNSGSSSSSGYTSSSYNSSSSYSY